MSIAIRTDNSIPWIEKYRPRKLDEMTQDDNLIELFKNSIDTGNLTHFIFYGPPGTGKTSAILAIGREIFKEHFSSRVIEFNASDDRGINAVREKITNEAKKHVAEIITDSGHRIPPYKVIILDEADSMTDEAQDALRVIIEQYSTVTRFCFICNYITRITDAIKSRCSLVYFKKLSYDCMVNKLKDIAEKESMTLKKNVFKAIIDVSNGDMRKAIMILQNSKYLYKYKKQQSIPLIELSQKELKNIMITNHDSVSESDSITENDIYEISATITISTAQEIIKKTTKCKNVKEIIVLAKEIIAKGYPIDNILSQLNKAILIDDSIEKIKKAKIIKYSGKILLKMKECTNEYIQLSDYLSCVNGIQKNSTVYD